MKVIKTVSQLSIEQILNLSILLFIVQTYGNQITFKLTQNSRYLNISFDDFEADIAIIKLNLKFQIEQFGEIDIQISYQNNGSVCLITRTEKPNNGVIKIAEMFLFDVDYGVKRKNFP